jgi:predicted MFS family arabinose efflux permease
MSAAQPTDHTVRNVLLLAICQGLVMIGQTTMIAVSALVGHALAENKAYATVPLAAMHVGIMLTTFPASFFMQRFGRRLGFSIGTICGCLGTLICGLAVIRGSFEMFCAGALISGMYNGFATFYRFAAADGASPAWKGRAISYVLAGGVISAVLGPEMAKATADLLPPYTFAASFFAVSALAIVAFCLLQGLRIPPPSRDGGGGAPRPLAVIARQPAFLVAVGGAIIAYASMNIIMTATPLAMVACGHNFHDAARVIQWHALAMFLPSFFTGHLIKRAGAPLIMAVGAVLIGICVAINLSGIGFWHFFVALVLLGLGWNFLFVGGTTLLTQTYRPEEKGKVQAVNDFLVFGSVTLTAGSAGAILNAAGWAAINLGPLPLVAIGGIAALWLMRRRAAAAAS